MELLVQSSILFISLVALVKSSQFVIDSALKIARMTKLESLVIGFILLSVTTSLPELAVSFSAITSGEVNISIGNILGSNITNIGLCVGLIAIIAPLTIKVTRKELANISSILFLSSLIPLLLLTLGGISRIVGSILIFIFMYFCFFSIRKKMMLKEKYYFVIKSSLIKAFIILFIGLICLIVSSKFIVDSAAKLAQIVGITESFIGATIIALGTSLPELSVSLESLKRGQVNLALGNAIGSCLTNLTLILGIILIVSPFAIDMHIFSTLLTFVVITSLLMWHFLSDAKIQLTDGIILLFVYIIFLVASFGVQVGLLEILRT